MLKSHCDGTYFPFLSLLFPSLLFPSLLPMLCSMLPRSKQCLVFNTTMNNPVETQPIITT